MKNELNICLHYELIKILSKFFAMGLFSIKPLDQLLMKQVTQKAPSKGPLQQGTDCLGIGAIIGAGIFVRTAAAAGSHAGSAVTLSFVIAGVGCALAGLCYAEFASMIPIAGTHIPIPMPPWENSLPGLSAGTWFWNMRWEQPPFPLAGRNI